MGAVVLLKRLASDGLMSVAMITTVVMTLVLLSTGPIYADAVSLGAARTALHDAPGIDTTIGVSVRTSPAEVALVDEVVTRAVDSRFAGIEMTEARSLTSASFRLPERATAELDELVVLRAVDGIADIAQLVEGTWPAPAEPASLGAQVAIDERIADELDVEVGDRIQIEPTRPARGPLTIEVAAIYRVADLSDRRWARLDDLVSAGSVSNRFRTFPFVAPGEVLLDLLARRLDVEWHLAPVIESIELDQLASTRRSVVNLERDLDEGLARRVDDPSMASEFRVDTGLSSLLSGTERSITVTRSSVFGVVFQLALLAGYALMLTSAVAVETRGREAALLRSRGARPRDLTLLALIEALVLTIPLMLAAPELASRALRLVDDVGPLASIGLRVAPEPTALSRLAAVVGGAITVGVLVFPVLRGARRAERDVGVTRESTTSASQRAGVDVALVVLCGVVYWQLSTLGDDRTATIRGRFGVDPLLIVAPALGLFTGAVIALRAA